MAPRALSRLVPGFLALVALVLAGCAAGGYSTTTKNGHEKVYRVEEGGKVLVYEVDADGQLTVHDENDPRAQQALEMQEKMAAAEAADAARIERIAAAPKRAANDPIRVLLFDLELGPNLAEAQHTPGAANEQLRKEFQGDALIQLTEATAVQGRELTEVFRMLAGESPSQAPASDVEVVSRAYLKEAVGINRSSGKLGSYAAVVFEATITSNYLPAEHHVEHEGPVLRNTQVTHEFAEKVKAVIRDEIGPTIPADRSL
jgi:hypothetical protein